MSLASRKLIQATAGAAGAADTGDDDFANVVLLLDGDGTSGDDNNTFTDSSTNGFTVTETGSVVQGSFSPYGDNWSNYFGGDSGLNFGDVTAVDFDANDWTIELWWNPQNLSTGDPFVFKDNVATRSFQFRHHAGSSTELQFAFWSSNTLYNSTTTSEFVYSAGFDLGEWYHIALVHDSGTFECFVNGTSIGTWTPAANNIDSGTDTLNVGYYSGGSPIYASGYLSNVRVVNGTALYTSNFTPSTSPLTAVTNTTLLTCQSNRFKDNSSNDYSVTLAGTPKVTPFSPFKDDDARDITTDGGSGYFDDSSNSYLQIADNSVFDATTSLCIEAWFYMTSSPGSGPDAHAIVSKWVSTTPGQRTIFIDIENTGLRVYADLQGASNPVLITTDGGAIDLYSWHHVAVTWDGSTYRAFLDGALEGSTSSSSAPIASSQVVRVGHNTNTHYFGGYITDARWVTDGGAIYTSAFTPPTSPLTAITNTELLLNFQDAGIYDRTGINNIDTVGTAQIDTAVKKYGTGSLEINETGNYLKIPSGSLGQALKGDAWQNKWTVECWVRSNSWTTYEGIWMIYQDQNNWIRLFKDTGDTFQVRGYTGGSQQFSVFGGTATDSTFQHLAAVRDGSTIKLYVDGTSVGTPDTIHTLPTFSDSTEMYIGRENFSTNHYLQGFVDDFRITLGVARYTSNFTPPTKALPKF